MDVAGGCGRPADSVPPSAGAERRRRPGPAPGERTVAVRGRTPPLRLLTPPPPASGTFQDGGPSPRGARARASRSPLRPARMWFGPSCRARPGRRGGAWAPLGSHAVVRATPASQAREGVGARNLGVGVVLRPQRFVRAETCAAWILLLRKVARCLLSRLASNLLCLLARLA